MKKSCLVCITILSILFLSGCNSKVNKDKISESTESENIENSESERKEEKIYKVLSEQKIRTELAALRDNSTDGEDVEFKDLVDSKSEEERVPYLYAYSSGGFYMDNMNIEDSEIITRKFDSEVNKKGYIGFNYRNVSSSIYQQDAPFIENNSIVVDAARKYVWTQTQRISVYNADDDYYFGTPLVVPVESEGKQYLQAYVFIYFNKDVPIKEIGKIKMDIKIEDKEAEDYEKYVGKSILGSFNNTLNTDFIYEFLGYDDFYTESEDTNWDNIGKYPLLSGGVIAYTAVVPVDNLDNYDSGEHKISINNKEFYLLSSTKEIADGYMDSLDTGITIVK